MSNKEWYLELDGPKPSLHGWIFRQMATGAGWAALVFFGVILLMFVVGAVGSILPDASKEAPAPMPQIESQLRLDVDRFVI